MEVELVTPAPTVELRDHGDVAELRLIGEVASSDCAPLLGCAKGLLACGTRNLVFDMARVTCVDSSGLGVLGQLRAEVQRVGGTLTVRDAPETVVGVLADAG